MVVYRPSLKQLVVAISGTSSVELASYDLRTLKRNHPSHRGRVHSGFWALYDGLKPMLFESIKKGVEKYNTVELVFTAHSMGASISYLACMDLLSEDTFLPLPLSPALKITLAAFGAPRTGDNSLVEFWRELVATYRTSYGSEKFAEYSVKAYNDGVPSLPPLQLGYRHFSADPLYLDKTRLYRVPQSECEHALFKIAPPAPDGKDIGKFPKGGHNYYNGRDFERLARRIKWLHKANIGNDGWEGRYQEHLSQNDT
ncbi:hypothetical protein C0991_010360 [Blastosporella zonata]|nr:hypothetical protein C0991_010360 [Blastosporella zonata]